MTIRNRHISQLAILPAVALVALAIALGSCGRKNDSGTADSADSGVALADSVAEELEDFSSPDLGLWNLTGPVSGAIYYAYEVKDTAANPGANASAQIDSITFDRRGLVTSMVAGTLADNKIAIDSDLQFDYDSEGAYKTGRQAVKGSQVKTVKLSRSSGGYLQVMQVLDGSGEIIVPGTYHRLIEWAGGRIFSDETESSEGNMRLNYSYGEGPFPEKATASFADLGGDAKIEDTYKYTKFDKYGNWTEARIVRKMEVTDSEADGTNAHTQESVQYFLFTRKIYYYPPEPKE